MDEPLNILLVEDSEDDALLVLRELRRSGFTLTCERVTTADALRTALAARSWHVLISDYRLPGFNAAMALEILKQSQLDIPFIVISGTIGETLAVELMKAGAHDYLMKHNLTRLPEAVRREVRDAEIRAERHRAMVELDQTKERLQLAIEGSGIGLWDWSIQAGTVTFNDRWAEIIGYTLQELEPIGVKTWQLHTHPDDFKQAMLLVEKHLRQEIQIYECELRMCHKAGHWVWVLARGKVVERDAMGNPLRMIGTHLDISDRKQTEVMLQQLNQELEKRVERRTADLQQSEARLRVAEERARATLLALPDLVFRVDREGRYSDFMMSPQGQNLVDPDQVIGKSITEGIPFGISEAHAKLQYTALQQAIATQTVQSYEQQIWVDDKLRYEEVRVAPCGNDEAVFFVRDISDRKESEAQLQRAYEELAYATRLKDEFLANMSHELRTPLTAILGMSETLKEEIFGALNTKQHQYIEVIASSGKHLLQLINDILDVSKISAGKLELDISAVSVESLCTSSLIFIKQLAFKKQIQLTTSLPTCLGKIDVDERRMRQVLINLLSNAVKFTPAGGQVTLEVKIEDFSCNSHNANGDAQAHSLTVNQESQTTLEADSLSSSWIVFSVIDTGIGIAPEDQSKLFRPFTQVDSSLNRRYEGTGLGLTLVKQIIELHGGSVSATSQLGKGSCFTVRIPYRNQCEDINMVSSSHHNHPHSQTNNPTASINPPSELISKDHQPEEQATNAHPVILLAEDNEGNIEMLSSYLEMHDYQILVAHNGQEAIDLAQAHCPDLILMDIQMPGVDGLTAIQTIRQDVQLAKVPIIALTALAMQGDRDRCLTAGANNYLAKPVKLKELVATIEQLLTSRLHH